jgi:hypothetical protein
MPEPAVASVAEREPEREREREREDVEQSAWLARVIDDATPLGSARRTGVGLLLAVPFAIAAGLRARHGLGDALVAGLGIPVGLALIALVGVGASTLGVSLAAAPLSPARAADVASRGLFRAGALLAGLAPVTALWVAGGRFVEALLSTTLVLATAGACGIGTIARGIVDQTAAPNGAWRVGAMGVALVFCGFALVVGLRLWIGTAAHLLPGFES